MTSEHVRHFARSGGPPAAASITSAASLKYAGPIIAGEITASCCTSSFPRFIEAVHSASGDAQRLPRTNLDGPAVNRPGKDALDAVEDLLVGVVLVGRRRQLLPDGDENLDRKSATRKDRG